MKLLDQVRQVARVKHFSYRTEQTYAYWAERYIRFHGIRHPNTKGTAEVEQFLPHHHWETAHSQTRSRVFAAQPLRPAV